MDKQAAAALSAPPVPDYIEPLYDFEHLSDDARWKLADEFRTDTFVVDEDMRFICGDALHDLGFIDEHQRNLYDRSSSPVPGVDYPSFLKKEPTGEEIVGVHVQYQIYGGQGSGANIYGDIPIEPLLRLGGEDGKLPESVEKALADIKEEGAEKVHIKGNDFYTYSMWGFKSTAEEVFDDFVEQYENTLAFEEKADDPMAYPFAKDLENVCLRACDAVDEACKKLHGDLEAQWDDYGVNGDYYDGLLFDEFGDQVGFATQADREDIARYGMTRPDLRDDYVSPEEERLSVTSTRNDDFEI